MDWVQHLHLSFYFLDDTMPSAVAAHIEELKAQNPTFEVTVWGPAQSRALIEREYPQFLEKYDAYPHGIQRSDFSRYAILHAMGGIYMDMDYVLKTPLREVLTFLDTKYPKKAAFVNETPNAVFLRRLSNSFMISKTAKHPFWLHVMHSANQGSGLSSHQRILTSTGPQAVDRSYRTYAKMKEEAVGVLPKKFFNPCGICSRGNACSKGQDVFAYHENAGGWNTSTGKAYNSLNCNMWWWIGALLFIIITATLLGLLVNQKPKPCRVYETARSKRR